jgi:hypothetical protein
MRVVFVRRDIVDCTADPHCVDFEDWNAAFDAVERVVKSNLVTHIRTVTVELIPDGKKPEQLKPDDYEVFASDYLSNVALSEKEKKKMQTTPESKENKTYGMFLFVDSDAKSAHHLPPGIRGAMEAIKIARRNIERLHRLSIGIIWSFAGDGSCSDYINIPAEESNGVASVDFSNQDWWIGREGYKEHCRNLSKIIGIRNCIVPNEEEA